MHWKRELLPWQKKRLGQVIAYVDDQIVIGNRVDFRAWELAIDQNTLQLQHTFKPKTMRMRTYNNIKKPRYEQ